MKLQDNNQGLGEEVLQGLAAGLDEIGAKELATAVVSDSPGGVPQRILIATDRGLVVAVPEATDDARSLILRLTPWEDLPVGVEVHVDFPRPGVTGLTTHPLISIAGLAISSDEISDIDAGREFIAHLLDRAAAKAWLS